MKKILISVFFFLIGFCVAFFISAQSEPREIDSVDKFYEIESNECKEVFVLKILIVGDLSDIHSFFCENEPGCKLVGMGDFYWYEGRDKDGKVIFIYTQSKTTSLSPAPAIEIGKTYQLKGCKSWGPGAGYPLNSYGIVSLAPAYFHLFDISLKDAIVEVSTATPTETPSPEAPIITITSPQENETISKLVLRGTVSDVSGVSKLQISVNYQCGGEIPITPGPKVSFEFESPFYTNCLKEGSNNVSLRADDTQGNSSLKTVNVIYKKAPEEKKQEFKIIFEDFYKTMDVPPASPVFQNWTLTNIETYGTPYQGEKIDLDIFLKWKNPDLRLKPGDKVHVILELYDKKFPYSSNKFFEILSKYKDLVYLNAYEGEVVEIMGQSAGKEYNIHPDFDIVRVKDAIFYPALYPDEIKADVVINIEGHGLVEVEGGDNISVLPSAVPFLNCGYGITDLGLEMLSGGLSEHLPKNLKDAANLVKGFFQYSAGVADNFKTQNWIEAGKNLGMLLIHVGKEFINPLKIAVTIYTYATRGIDCIKDVIQLVDFYQGLQTSLAIEGIKIVNTVILQSPASLMITTSDGKKIGFDQSDKIVNELGEKGEVVAGHPALVVFEGTQSFDITVSGKEKGSFGLAIFQNRENEFARIDYSDVPSIAQSKATVKLDPQSKEEPQLAIDENNDGTIDSYKKPDKFEVISPPPSPTEQKPGEESKETKLPFIGIIAGLTVFVFMIILLILNKKGILAKILKKN